MGTVCHRGGCENTVAINQRTGKPFYYCEAHRNYHTNNNRQIYKRRRIFELTGIDDIEVLFEKLQRIIARKKKEMLEEINELMR